jgi:kynureninase
MAGYPGETMNANLLELARKHDQENELRSFRDRFDIPRKRDGSPATYLVGNSLGLQPKKARQYIEEELEDWKQLAVEAHFHGKRPWKKYQNGFSEPLARVVGAKPSEVVAMNSLGVNLHLLMLSFYLPTQEC